MVNRDEVKGKVFLTEHYSAHDRNFPHTHPPSLWLELVSTATIVQTRLGSSKRLRTRLMACALAQSAEAVPTCYCLSIFCMITCTRQRKPAK